MKNNSSQNTHDDTEEQNQKKRSTAREAFSYLKVIAAAVIVSVLLSRFVLINAFIPSESMENLLSVKDRVFGCRLSYLFNGPERYDVVLFHYPVNGTIYIKRVIGLPNETVEIRKGKIYIDGSEEPIKENYLPEKWVSRNDGYTFEVPDDCYLMLGDNRNYSEDARDWAQCAVEDGIASNEEEAQKYQYVHKDEIIARAVLKYYPKVHVFLNIDLP